MPVGRDPSVVSEVQKDAHRSIFLLEVWRTTGVERYANTNGKLVVGGNEWVPLAFRFQGISRQGGKEVGRATIIVDNSELDFSKALELEEYDGQKVTIYIHFPDVQDSLEVYFRGYVEGFSINPKEARISVVPVTDYMALCVPPRRYMTKCPWVFKDGRCTYTGPETECPSDKEYDGCPVPEAFGGFPYIKVS